MPRGETGESRERNHRLQRRRDGRAGRGGRMAAGGERVGGEIARRIRGDRRRRAGRAGRRREQPRGDAGLLGAGRIGAGGRDVEFVERARILPVARRDLHDDMILVLRAIDDRNLPLAERVVECVVDRIQGEAQAHRRVAVDGDVGLEPALLLVGIDVLDDIAVHQRCRQLRRPFVEFGRVVGEQRVLIGRVALRARRS